MKIFETYAESYPTVRDQRVVDLCLVNKYWNTVANDTPQLWTRINLSFPFAEHQVAAAHKRVSASKLEKIDVSIDFRKPKWNWDEPVDDWDGSIRHQVREITNLLRGTEERWKSIKVVSHTWLPLHMLMEVWTFTHLPSTESISMERDNSILGMWTIRQRPQSLIGPMTLFGQNASLPKLRNLTLCGVHVDWDDASVCYQNLRKLEINKMTYDVGPSFEQFAAMLSSSPRLEYLDVTGFSPEHHTIPDPPDGRLPKIPVVHLPALKELVFGWKNTEDGYSFLHTFQIGSSLERLTLIHTESCIRAQTKNRRPWWHQDSDRIFTALYNLGLAAPQDEDDIPPGPFIAMRGMKNLRIIWTEVNARSSLVPFLTMLTGLESIWLEDVDMQVLEDVASVQVGMRSAMTSPPLTANLRWSWRKEAPRLAEPSIVQLKNCGVKVTVKAVDYWKVWQGWSSSCWWVGGGHQPIVESLIIH